MGKGKSCFSFLKALIVSWPLIATADYYELSLTGSYSRTSFNRLDYSISSSANASIAYFFWASSAIELGYSRGRSKSFRDSDILVDAVLIDKQEEIVHSEVYSISWRQYLWKSELIQPYVRGGYALYKSDSQLKITLDDGETIGFEPQAESIRSGLAGMGLHLGISSSAFFRVEVFSVFPNIEIEKYKERLRYQAGLTWLI